MKNKPILTEVWNFMKVRKKWWLIPLVFMMVLVSIVIMFGASSGLSSFVYALF